MNIRFYLFSRIYVKINVTDKRISVINNMEKMQELHVDTALKQLRDDKLSRGKFASDITNILLNLCNEPKETIVLSSKEQEREGYSIPAQLKLLNEYAVKNNFIVEYEFVDNETAKKTGRTNFTEMIKKLKKNKEVRTIIVEKTDRLYRNFKDYVLLDEFEGLEVHLVKEFAILTENSKSHEKLMHGIKVLMAKNYIDNLSEEVKKGQRQKAEQGEYPGKPPFGYYRENSKTIKIDIKDAPFVLRAFNLYAEGHLSLDSVCERLREEGFIYKSNSPKIYKSKLENMLRNNFYIGNFTFKSVAYIGKHEPLIDIELFEKVQQAFKKDNKPDRKKQHEFLFSGMFKCAECGSTITAEIKKGQYVYYRCTNRKKTCSHKSVYVRQEKLIKQFDDAIKDVNITTEHKKAIITALKESHEDEQKFHEEQIAQLKERGDKLRNRISNLYTDKLDGLISVADWAMKNNEWTYEHSRLNALIEKHMDSNKNYMEKGVQMLELAENVYSQYIQENEEEKAKLIKIVCQNFLLEGSKASYEYKKPFDILSEGLNCSITLGRKDSNL